MTDRVTRTVPLGPGRPIRVDATVGDVTIVGSNRPDVTVEIVRRAPSADGLTKFPVVVDDSGDALRIGAVQVADGRDASLVSTIVIRAPAAATFQSIRVFEGRLRVSGLTGACDADVRRGSIEASIAGRVRLQRHGAVDVKACPAPAACCACACSTVAARAVARAPVNARILAVTLSDQIASTFADEKVRAAVWRDHLKAAAGVARRRQGDISITVAR